MSCKPFVAFCGAAVLSACAPPHIAPPHLTRPEWTRLGNTSTETSGPVYHRDPHHQYFDKSHNRYYYYDPVLKRFFWENGQPKG